MQIFRRGLQEKNKLNITIDTNSAEETSKANNAAQQKLYLLMENLRKYYLQKKLGNKDKKT